MPPPPHPENVKGASTNKTFSVTLQALAFLKNSLKFVIVSIIYGYNCSLQLGIRKNCAMEKAKCEIWQKYNKCTNFSSHMGWLKGSNFVGWKMLQFLGPEFVPHHRKYLQGKKDAIFG